MARWARRQTNFCAAARSTPPHGIWRAWRTNNSAPLCLWNQITNLVSSAPISTRRARLRRIFFKRADRSCQNQISITLPTASTTYARMATQNPYSVMYGIGVNTPITAIIAIISETTNSHIAGAWSFIVSFPFATGRLAGSSCDGLHHNPPDMIHRPAGNTSAM